MFRRHIRARVHYPGGNSRGFEVIFEERGIRVYFMTNGRQFSVPRRAQSDSLIGLRTRADRTEHLWSLQDEFDRPVNLFCRHHRQRDVRPQLTLAAKAAANE